MFGMSHVPEVLPNAYRVILTTASKGTRLDGELLRVLRAQKDHLDLQTISREKFKKLFNEKKILIKGQPAKPSSTLASGVTYVDILMPEKVARK